MKARFVSLMSLMAVAVLFACGRTSKSSADEIVTRSIKVATVTEIEVNNALTVEYTVSPTVSVTLSAPKSLIDNVQITTDSKGKLKCSIKKSLNNKDNGKVVVKVTAPAVNDFEVSGASSLTVMNDLVLTGDLDIELSGASNFDSKTITATNADVELYGASVFNGTLQAKSLDLEASGASTVNIGGIASVVEVEANGASTVNMKKLNVSGGEITASGASTVNANSTAQKMRQSATGASSINIK